MGVPTFLVHGDVYFWGSIMAGCFISCVPIAILYNFFVDRFIAGFTVGQSSSAASAPPHSSNHFTAPLAPAAGARLALPRRFHGRRHQVAPNSLRTSAAPVPRARSLPRATEGVGLRTAVHICYGYGIKGNIEWKQTLGREWRQYEQTFPLLARSRIDQVSLECASSHVPLSLLRLL